MIIYILFAVSLQIIWRFKHIVWKTLVVLLIIAQLAVLIPSNEQITYRKSPSFDQFYAVNEFSDIKKFIGKPVQDYRVVSIGLNPAVAQYNGMYTLDTYNNFYPLSYKHQFRKIIAPELAKSRTLKNYFDQWGGRCYIFVSELGEHYTFSKGSKKDIQHLDLNIQVLKQMGGNYVLSAVPIKNAKKNSLSLQKIFDSKDAYWRIYLYKVI